MLKICLSFLLFIISLIAKEECSLDYSIMHSIQKIERHSKCKVGYPYLISFNSPEDVSLAKKKFNLNWLDDRSVNCEELIKCETILKKLTKAKIDNLDLGAYQINYKFHKMKFNNYFNNNKSYIKACKILEELIQRYGISADTIARYHSSTNKYKNAYATKFFNSFVDERLIVGSDMFYYYY
jgi:hypothetical protein